MPDWLRDAVFYQIYPQSFRDSNGDGIGDLPGVIEKLDYVADTGFTAIWLNPCFVSPFRDAGYDVTDFYTVAPRYGTNEDLVKLFQEAHRRGLKVVLDLVAGHTSLENEWFQASARHERNEYSNWFIWSDHWLESDPSLKMTNGIGERNGNFVTNFFYCQPALNYGFANPDPKRPWQLPVEHPDVMAVRRELERIMRFWLGKGADGFRIDMAASLVKADPDKEETIKLWNSYRAMFDDEFPDAALIAEWSDPSLAIRAGFHVDFLIHFNSADYTSLFRYEKGRNVNEQWLGDSYFDRRGKGDIATFLEGYTRHFDATKTAGYISLPTGNHDLPRIRLGRDTAELKVAYAFLLTMPGVPFVYYGDEIGMRHLDLPSKEGAYTRTGARTPMQWDDRPGAGFSEADPAELYLPVDEERGRPTVSGQRDDPDSLYNLVRSLIALRKQASALSADGDFIPLTRTGYPFVYLRRSASQEILVVINPRGTKASAHIPLRPKAGRASSSEAAADAGAAAAGAAAAKPGDPSLRTSQGHPALAASAGVVPVMAGGGRCTASLSEDELFVDIGPVGWAIFEMEGR